MGSSYIGNVSDVIMQVFISRATTILDIGIGFGRWGFLCREMLDVVEGRELKEEWTTRIDGIEIYEPYIQPLQRFVYDQIYVGDAKEVIKTLGRYDVIIIGDMLEHLPKMDAWSLFHDVMERTEKLFVLNLPIGEEWLRETGHDNKYEDHLSWWSVEEFAPYHPGVKENVVGTGSLHVTFFFDPRNYRYAQLMADAEKASSGQEKADFLMKAGATAPDRPESYMELADLLLAAAQVTEAVEVLRSMLEQCPDYGEGRLLLALLLRQVGRVDECIVQYRHLADHAPEGSEEKEAAQSALREMGV